MKVYVRSLNLTEPEAMKTVDELLRKHYRIAQ